MTELTVADLGFYWAALRQLPPELQPAFEARVLELLRPCHDPGAGDVHRAVCRAVGELQVVPAQPRPGAPSRWTR